MCCPMRDNISILRITQSFLCVLIWNRFFPQHIRHQHHSFSILFFIQGPPINFFFENALKKLLNNFLNFFFLFESTILPVNNGKYFHSNGCLGWPCSSLHNRFVHTLLIVWSYISPTALRVLPFKASIVFGLSG